MCRDPHLERDGKLSALLYSCFYHTKIEFALAGLLADVGGARVWWPSRIELCHSCASERGRRGQGAGGNRAGDGSANAVDKPVNVAVGRDGNLPQPVRSCIRRHLLHPSATTDLSSCLAAADAGASAAPVGDDRSFFRLVHYCCRPHRLHPLETTDPFLGFIAAAAVPIGCTRQRRHILFWASSLLLPSPSDAPVRDDRSFFGLDRYCCHPHRLHPSETTDRFLGLSAAVADPFGRAVEIIPLQQILLHRTRGALVLD